MYRLLKALTFFFIELLFGEKDPGVIKLKGGIEYIPHHVDIPYKGSPLKDIN